MGFGRAPHAPVAHGMTPQNTALAKQSATAAEGLKSGAVALARSVQVFHMP